MLSAALLLCAAGCGGHALDEDLAVASLSKALEAWQSGGNAGDLGQADPQIVVGDAAWKEGQTLIGFEIVGKGTFDGKNLRVPVKLKLQPLSGKQPVTSEVTYVVGTDPVITVFRVCD